MKKIALVLAVLGLSSSAYALESGLSETGISYNEVGVGYGVEGDVGGDYKGFGIGVSTLLAKNLYFNGQFKNPSSTETTTNLDTQQYTTSLGFRTAITSNADLYASAGYYNGKFSFTGGSIIATGYVLATGIRAIVLPKVEASLNLSYADGKNRLESFSETRYRVGLGYQFTDKIIGRSTYYTTPDSLNGYSVSLGYMF